jgi:hypothetical protein
MKLTRLWLAALALPVTAAAQGPPAKAKTDPKVSLAVITTNVAKVNYASEKDRWLANIGAWKVALAHPVGLDSTELCEVKSWFGMMAFNLSTIRDVGEKERWQANVDLWHLLIAGNGVLLKSDVPKAKTLVDKITTNLARVDDAAEMERWQANLDIWKAVIDRANTVT